MKTKQIRIFLIALIALFGLIIFILSAQNAESSNGLSDKVLVWLRVITWKDIAEKSYRYYTYVGVIRQLAHFSLYAVSAVPVFLLIYTYKEKIMTVYFLTIGFVGLYAVIDEFHQLFVSGRSFQIFDMVTDLFGALCASSVMAFVTFITNVIYNEHSNEKV